jgi:hypothetical protein
LMRSFTRSIILSTPSPSLEWDERMSKTRR